jgi:adenomatosis polyposis coli protein
MFLCVLSFRRKIYIYPNVRCIPLLVQLLHIDPQNPRAARPARPVRARAARSLHNIVHAHPSDKHCKREAKVLKLLEVVRQYCDLLRDIGRYLP